MSDNARKHRRERRKLISKSVLNDLDDIETAAFLFEREFEDWSFASFHFANRPSQAPIETIRSSDFVESCSPRPEEATGQRTSGTGCLDSTVSSPVESDEPVCNPVALFQSRDSAAVLEPEDSDASASSDCSTNSDIASLSSQSSSVGSQEDIVASLREWAVDCSVQHSSIDALLPILSKKIPGLPRTARTLLETPRASSVIAIGGGEYHHFGLANGIKQVLDRWSYLAPQKIEVSLNVDGLPLFRNSSKHFWCILGLLHHPSQRALSSVFIIGVFCGTGKPASAEEFLGPCIAELERCLAYGLDYQTTRYTFSLRAVVCDAPARAFVKQTVSHNAYAGCDKCTVEGEFHGRMTFPCLNAPLRTDDSFVRQLDEGHHKGVSPFANIGIPMVTRFPLDYLHLVCLGIGKKLPELWIKGPLQVRMSSHSVASISQRLVNLREFVPVEFHRKCRGLRDYDRWKATECRFFVVYGGPVVLHGSLRNDLYEHFLVFHFCITILLTPSLQHLLDYAEKLLHFFVRMSLSLYGKESIVYNMHSLIHLVADCRLLGPLDNFSSFPFETYLHRIKRYIRSGNKPLQQLHRRVSEDIACRVSRHAEMQGKEAIYRVVPSTRHSDGPTLGPADGQFRKACIKGFMLSLNKADRHVLLDGHRVLKVKNIQTFASQLRLICQEFTSVSDLYTYPYASRLLSICCVSDLSSTLIAIEPTEVIAKGMLLPLKEKFAFFPLRHLF